MNRKVISGRIIGGAFRSIVNSWSLQGRCMPVFRYGSEKESSMKMVVQMDNLRGLLGIRIDIAE